MRLPSLLRFASPASLLCVLACASSKPSGVVAPAKPTTPAAEPAATTATPVTTERLAADTANPALGEIAVIRTGGKTTFDFDEFKSEMASKRHPDGSLSFVTTVPGFSGLELIVGDNRTLVLRDAQHEYVFEAR